MADGGSEMVERVERAIEQGVCSVCGRPAVGQITPQDCDRRPECNWRPGTTTENARAAIQAMREPTPEILALSKGLAGNELCWDADEAVVARVLSAIVDAALGKPRA